MGLPIRGSKAALIARIEAAEPHRASGGPEHMEPPVSHQEAPIETREDVRFWPADRPMPDTYHRQQRQPCPECKRVHLENLSQAVIVTSIRDEIAYLLCRHCRHRGTVAVR